MPTEGQIEFNINITGLTPSRWSTIRGSAEGEGQYIRQTAGPGHYGKVKLLIEPYNGSSQYVLEWLVKDKQIPTEYIPAVIQGIQQSVQHGRPDHGPIINVKVKVLDGQYHIIDSQPSSFTVAAFRAFENALEKVDIINLDAS